MAATGAPASGQAPERDTAAYRPGYERVSEEILRLIVELRLQPGDRMPTEKELAARLGTSRTVVREAVKILSAIGRIRAQKGRGLFVANDEGMLASSRWGSFFLPTDLDHVYQLFEFRRVQEVGGRPPGAPPAPPPPGIQPAENKHNQKQNGRGRCGGV
ncbi:GntR family transcriptional regulator, partial [Streptomyces sp. NPDC048106]|uniref:FadR/GntR family transcriptional regulator n=1 Tax=Streptomyces sp. NPDC048106 TaxID=3155750 RepID=UPI0034552D2F